MNAFDGLRRADGPIVPSARFAELLRSQVEAALAADGDVPTITRAAVTRVAVPPTAVPSVAVPSSTGSPTMTRAQIVPYLCVADAAAALAWYSTVFGAVETVRYSGDDGRIGHAEIDIDGARLMLSDAYPEVGVDAPPVGATTWSSSINLNVADVDAVFDRAVANGATVQRPPADQPYGERSCTIVDPYGHRWMVQTTLETPTADEIGERMDGFTVTAASPEAPAPVEVGYLTMGFDDVARAQVFYGALFGWATEPGNLGVRYAHIHNTRLPMGMTPDGSGSSAVLYFRVDDAAAYADRAVALGGAVVERASYESGGDIVCRDDQGREFHLWQPAEGY